jgi:hypothetical protein
MSQNNLEMDFNITDLPMPQQFAISNEDIQKIDNALKSKLYEDIVCIINENNSGSGRVGLLVRSKRVFGVDASDIRKYKSNILSNQM